MDDSLVQPPGIIRNAALIVILAGILRYEFLIFEMLHESKDVVEYPFDLVNARLDFRGQLAIVFRLSIDILKNLCSPSCKMLAILLVRFDFQGHLDKSYHCSRSRLQRRKNVRGIPNCPEDGPRSSQRVGCLGKANLISQTVHDDHGCESTARRPMYSRTEEG